MLNLVTLIEEIDSKISALEAEKKKKLDEVTKYYDELIEKYKAAKEINTELNEVCLRCKGRGTIRYAGACGISERDTCPACGGNGKAK